MVNHQGYCRPLKRKVEFTVSAVEGLDTIKGIKWLVRGNYESHKITTFTNKETAELLLSKLNDGAEEIEVFGAEIAVEGAETVLNNRISTLEVTDDVAEYSTHRCKHCREGIYYHTQGEDIGNQPIRESWCGNDEEGPENCSEFQHEPYEGEADGINATYKTSIREEPNLVYFEKAGGTVNLKDATDEMYKKWDRLYLIDGNFIGYGAEIAVEEAKSFESEVVDIDWETDGEEVDLPSRVSIPSDLEEDEVADYLSDKYGWLVNGFVMGAESFDAESLAQINPVVVEDSEDIMGAESFEGLDAKYIKKDGTPDKRYKVVREWLSNKDAEEIVEAQAPEMNSYDAEQMFSTEPASIIYDEYIPHEIWNAMDDSARGQYLATRDESLLVSPCCGVSKAEIRTNFDANEECGSCCFAGEDFLPEYWASEPAPSITQQYDAEGLDIEDTNANTAAIPNKVYYDMMLDLPDTVTATQTDDGLTMILGFHNQNAELVDSLIKTYAPPEDMGEPDTLYAEETYIHEAEPNVDMPVPTEPSTVNSALSFTPPETSLRDAEEFGSEGIEIMSLEEYYSNVFSFSDNDTVQTNFNGEVIVQRGSVEMGAESFDAEEEMYVFRDGLNCGIIGTPTQFKRRYGSSNVKEIKKIIKKKDDLERVPSLIKFELQPKTLKRILSRKTPLDVDFNWKHQWNSQFEAESNLSFDDWAEEEDDDEGHKSNMTFEEWIDDEISEHGDVPLSQFKEDELKEPEHKGSESFEATTPCPVRVWDNGELRECGWWNEKNEPCVYHPDGKGIYDAESENWQEEEIDWDAKDNKQEEEDIFEEVEWEAESTSCAQCGRFGYDDEMRSIEGGYLCARCSNPHLDFSNLMEAEDKKINKTLIGLLGIGALGAILAPKQIKDLFKKFNN